ncbi:MAG: NAD-dependent epimerase/dehydratase family protein [Planctomycetaceae bacterium]
MTTRSLSAAARPATWVLGARGLLGRALKGHLRQTSSAMFQPACRFAWDDERLLREQLAHSVTAFALQVREAGSWELYWAAGVAGMGTPAAAVAAESRAFEWLVDRLEADPILGQVPGRFLLASSAGGIYAGSREAVVDEATPEAPTTPYAQGKLDQENRLRQSRLAAAGCRVLLARISTMYGPFLPGDTRQGLISTMARCVVRNRPVPIFVPLDTARDYIDTDDAARIGIATLQSLPQGAEPTVKIVAAESLTTVAELLATFHRVAHRRLLFTTSVGSLSGLYTMRFRFRSRVCPGAVRFAKTTLLQGVARVVAAERLRCQHPFEPDARERGP